MNATKQHKVWTYLVLNAGIAQKNIWAHESLNIEVYCLDSLHISMFHLVWSRHAYWSADTGYEDIVSTLLVVERPIWIRVNYWWTNLCRVWRCLDPNLDTAQQESLQGNVFFSNSQRVDEMKPNFNWGHVMFKQSHLCKLKEFREWGRVNGVKGRHIIWKGLNRNSEKDRLYTAIKKRFISFIKTDATEKNLKELFVYQWPNCFHIHLLILSRGSWKGFRRMMRTRLLTKPKHILRLRRARSTRDITKYLLDSSSIPAQRWALIVSWEKFLNFCQLKYFVYCVLYVNIVRCEHIILHNIQFFHSSKKNLTRTVFLTFRFMQFLTHC